MSLTKKLFSFEGRLRRRDWWLLNLIVVGVQLLTSAVVTRVSDRGLIEASLAAPLTKGWLVMTAVSLPFVWPTLAVAVKRGHDRGLSGFWSVAVMLVLYAPGVAAPEVGSSMELLFSVLSLAVGLPAVVLFGILDGPPGVNRFGPSPKHSQRLAEVFG